MTEDEQDENRSGSRRKDIAKKTMKVAGIIITTLMVLAILAVGLVFGACFLGSRR